MPADAPRPPANRGGGGPGGDRIDTEIATVPNHRPQLEVDTYSHGTAGRYFGGLDPRCGGPHRCCQSDAPAPWVLPAELRPLEFEEVVAAGFLDVEDLAVPVSDLDLIGGRR